MENKTVIFIIALIFITSLGVIKMTGNAVEDNVVKKVKLETSEGDIVIELYSNMPVTAGNFEKLVGEGFYDGVIFHRIIDGFMIQGGGYTSAGEKNSQNIQDEFVKGPSNVRGTISMANTGQPNSGGSQFFINLVDNSNLDFDDMRSPRSKHPVFGKVVNGMDIVDKLGKVEVDGNAKPLKEVKIIKASVV